MIINIFRQHKKQNYTIGKLFVNNVYFCDTLELVDDGDGTKPMTAIPAGYYECAVTHSPKFQRNLIEIKNVPKRTEIKIHSGNTAKDTQGCVLVGKNTEVGVVTSSKAYEKKLLSIVENCVSSKDKVFLIIHS